MFDKSNFKDIYSLSPMQQGMLFHSIMDNTSGAYFEQSRFSIKGQIDISLFERSFNYIIEKYDVVRTVFLYEKVSQPVQIVLRKRTGKILYNDISYLEEEERKSYIVDFTQKDKMQSFELSKDLPMRIAVIKTDEEKYEVIWSYHHIIMDGWCLGIIMSDFFKAYSLLGKGKEISTANNYPYSDYIKWLKRQNKEEALAYWKNYLQDYEQQASIPKWYKRTNENIYSHCDTQFELNEAITERLIRLAKENQISLNIILQTIWGILLQKYNNTKDVVFGAVVSGRPPEVIGIESMVGLFINTIPVRIKGNDKSFIVLCKEIQENATKSMAYDYMPLADVQANTKQKNNLFDHIMAFENYPMDKQVNNMASSQELGFSIQNYEMLEHTNYDFNLAVIPGETIIFKFTHNENVYSKELVEQICSNFKMAINQVIENSDINIASINIVDTEEAAKLLQEFNNTKTEYPIDKTIQQLFEEQVTKTPDNIAVEYKNTKLTYKELNTKANDVATILQNKGVEADSIVGIMIDRSLDMIVGIMAILKAGGAYLPIDPEYPKDRIEYMLSDSNTKILLTQSNLTRNVEFDGETIIIEDILCNTECINARKTSKATDLAYIIYTSGSTGKPKGVMIEHKSVINLAYSQIRQFKVDKKDRILQFSTICFDASIEQIFIALLSGAALVLINKDTLLNVEAFEEYLIEHEVTHIHTVPTFLNNINYREEYKIKRVVAGGDICPVNLAKYWSEHCDFYNEYGPTETTITSTMLLANNIMETSSSLSIGRPLNNIKVYILDKNNNIQPIGIPGEIYIAGDCLARGYLNRQELTAEKFIEDPFEAGTKMYKTGDLARWLPDGNIEFLGRIDSQVKVRGFRIELGEIEARLLSYEGIEEAIVITKEDKDSSNYLCAYVSSTRELTISEIRSYLGEELPEYMIPSYIIQLEKLPITANGKIDRKALPEPDGSIMTGIEYVAPINETEEKLAAIWKEVLGLEKVGTNDNFFELGGHSLKAINVMGKIHKELNVEIPLKQLFKTPTIRGLYEYIGGLEENIYSTIEPIEEKEYYSLSSAQKRMYALQQFEEGSTSYNMPMVIAIEGELDRVKLEEVFKKLIKRHEVFRTSFKLVDGEAVQLVHKEISFKIEYTEVDKEKAGEIAAEFVKAFDLSKAPLIRVALTKINDKEHILMIDMNHIISDGVSMGILTKEFMMLYDGKELSKLRIQYKDFAVWQNELFKSGEIIKQEEYWLKALSDEIPVLNMPSDYKRPSMQSFEGDNLNFELSEELTAKLKQITRETGSTMYMILLSACNILLSKYSGQEDIIVGSPIAGRPHADLENIMGMFVNTLAMRNYPENSMTFKEFLAEVKASSLQAFENQDYQFEELVDKLNITRDLSRNPLFDVMFTMQNMDAGELQIKGLSFKPYEIDNKISKFDMTIIATELDKTIGLSLNYCTKLFKKQTIQRMSKHLTNILNNIANNTSLRLSEVEMLSDGEKHQLLVEFNNTKAGYQKDKIIQQLFEEQVEKTPSNIAVVYKEEKLTYKELNEKANIIARILRNKGIKQNEIIGIMVEGSTEMIVGILGILKAGATYLPIDPKYPTDRITYMIEDSKTRILLTDFQPKDMISENTELILLKDKELYKGENTNLEITNTPKDIAYIIYTSGSTGKPKGVMIEHGSLVNMCKWNIDYYEVTEEDNITKYAGFGFDASVWEIFPSIIAGAAIHIIDEEIKLDLEKLNEYYNDNKITISFLPTQISEQFMKLDNQSLRYLQAAGDKLRYFEGKNYKVVNNYGPTENTVVTTSFIVDKEYDNISIGKPISNTQIYILDKNNKLQAIGIPGELCITGESLARGYLNNTKLTAEKFIENPFVKGQRLYKTGDLARWMHDGNIEFLGRIDNQVKIRGYRIELGEIENELLKHSKIREAIVTAKEDTMGNKYLCAYIAGEVELSSKELREHLSKELPEYMIPAYFIQLEKLPLTANGKVDKKALPEPDGSVTTGTEYVAPESEIEEKLVSIWSEVLGIEKIGIDDNFFELGGHSLKAINLVAKINKELNVSVPLKEMFKTPTIKGLANYIKGTKQSIYSRIEPVEEREYYPLSSAQKRIYTLQQFEENNISYNMPMVMTLEGELDKNKLEETFNKLVQRHETLRTSFEIIDGEPVQVVHKEISFEIEYTEADKEKAREIAAEFVKVFDLSKAPLLRVALTKINDKEHILMIDMHHIISDGTSMGILTKEFMELYDGKELAELRIQYKDFAVWQNELFKSGEINKQEEYWLKAFEGEVPVLNLPTDYQRASIQSFEGDNISFELNEELTNKLKQIAKETGSTMYMVLLSACNVLLSKYSGQEDIIVGSPIAGRPHADLENIMGMFVNTLAMRNYPESSMTFKEFLTEVKVNSLQAFENQDYQFEELVDELNITRDLSRNPLFDVMFSMQNMDTGELQIEGLKFKPYEIDNNIAKFDITITAVELNKTIGIDLNYCTKLFNKQTIENMSKHLINILDSIVNNTNLRLSEVGMLTEEEKHKLLVEFNNIKTEYPKDKTIQQLFEEQVTKTPDNIAVVFEEKQLTYRELNEKSDTIARILRSKGVKADDAVAILVDKSIEMIIGVIAILKAGGAYLPIDIDYPTDRIQYILSDSGSSILLTQTDRINTVNFDGHILILDNQEIYNTLSTDCNDNLEIINNPSNLAYIIYTSGSTGKPKGVMVEHKNVVRLVKNTNYISFSEDDRILQTGALVFDASTFEIWGALLNGLPLYLFDKNIILDANKLTKAIEENNITIMWLTAALFNQLQQEKEDMFKSLRYLLVGGDILSPKHINAVREKNPNLKVINGYGPTENTTFSTCFRIEKEYTSNIPIGSPISNSTVYIVDKSNSIQPVGVVGELWVGGDGVARGYLNNKELTAEKFIESPFVEGERIYKTGDLARWLSDGTIEFIGRIDQQVKIRGFRIELGEIENELLKHDKIKEAIVIAKEDNSKNKYLCAYIAGEIELNSKVLREHLSKELPEYMIPAYFIQLEQLPLTANGKVDRKSLPDPDGSISTGAEYVAPESEIEEKLVSIWQEVLGIAKIGINDNFFELGGHSLKAINISAKISKELNVTVPLREMFKTPTIKGLANYVAGTKQSIYSRIETVEESEYYQLSSAQKRMYTLQQFEKNSISYNIPMVMTLEGELDKSKLEETFDKLIQRHEALRTSFEVIDGEPVQVVHKEISFEIEYTETDKEKAGEIAAEFVKAFDLSKAPLIRVALVKIKDKEHILMIDMHHIISDGTSMVILTKEFMELYDGKELQKLRIQYKDFALWQNELFKSGEIKKQEEYWLKAFEGEVPALNMPTDYQRPSIQSFEGDNISFELNEELTNKLKQIAKETGSTMYMVLLSACTVLLSKYSGQEDIIIGSPTAGRPHADLENIMGMFVNTLAMRNYPESSMTFKKFLAEVKASSLQAFENQDYQFEELIDKLNITRDLSRNPLFDVMFVMQNMDAGELQIEGLKFKPYEIDNNIAKFDITITAVELNKTIGLSLNYCTKLFNKQTIQRMSKHLKNILNSISNNTNLRLLEVEMLSEEEKQQLLVEFNNTKVEYQKDKIIQQLFEEQVEKTPNNIAVVYKEEKLTYKELNEKANIIARILRNKGIKQNEIVGIIVEGSTEMIVGILGILKAGATYLPIDPKYPIDRITYMIEDSKTRILLTDFQPKDMIGENTELILLKDKELYKGENTNLEIINTPKDIAYIIYTSGSTGKPKGVMIEHSSLVNMCKWNIDYYEVTKEDNITKYAGFGFDASIPEIFPGIITGAVIHIIDEEIKLDLEKLNEYYNENKITISFLPTQISEQFMKLDNHSLRYLLAAGDKLRYFEGKKYKVVNNYGPTENTVVTTSFIVDKEYDNIPIGKPISNTKIYILDKNNKLQAIGIPGELCITGESLARGYLNNTELTAEKFIENPFAKGQRLYKTGDLARWLPDGNIEFLGRIDNQVKIRGYRIELGEIEARILSYKGIEETIVIAREDKNKNKYLCGYIVADKEEIVEDLKDYLAKELPEYMIPAYFIKLEKLPLTANGKVDRKALPEPDGTINAGVEYVAPTNEIEEKLVNIWQEVLGIEKIGLNDNFFSLGGDSIKAIQVTSRLYQYNMKLEVKQLFQHQTISKISKYVEYSNYKSSQEPITGENPLTPIQKWFFERSFTNKYHWNQAVMLNAIKGFDESIINKVFTKILEHHDALRATYEISGQEVKQVIKPINKHMYDFEVYDFRNISDYLSNIESKANEVQASIDLEKGPLVKLALFKTIEGDYLLISIHHLVVDGVSWRIIFEDFATGYNQCLNNQNIELQLKTDSYKAWVEVLNSYSSSDEISKEIEYWTALENNNVIPLSDSMSDYMIAKDSLSVVSKLKDTEAVAIELTVDQTEKLQKKVNSKYNTEINDILLSALGYALKEWTGNDSILIELEGHGREENVGDINIKRTVGWFTSNYPVILDMSKSDSISYQIKSIKESLRQIPNKGIGYGILKYLTPIEQKQKLACSLKPEIGFNYLGQLEENATSDIFSMSGISFGNSMSLESEKINLIDINGIIAENKLVLNFSYSKQQLTRAGIQKLADYYKRYLIDIIEHCVNVQETMVTPSDITLKGTSIEQLDEIYDLVKSNFNDIYNLSPMQQGMLFHSIIDSSSNAYFEQTKLSIKGFIDIALFEKSFNYIIEKYDPLRTVFLYEKVKQPLQVVLKKRNGNILYDDISSFSEAAKQIYIEEFKQKDKKRSFNLSKDLLVRISVIKTGVEEYEIIWSFHHIVMDGWCLGIIMGDFFKAYSVLTKGNTISATNNYPYSDYIKWLQVQNKEDAMAYWKNYLQGYEQQVSIPKLYKKTNEDIFLHQEYQFELSEAVTLRLTNIAKENKISLNVMLQTVWGILLQKYNNTKDIVFGAVVSGRPPEVIGIEKMVGLFINTIPVRIQKNDISFIELAKEIQQNALESMAYDYLPLADIQVNTELKNNLFDHIMVFENYPMDKQVSSMDNEQALGFAIKGLEAFEQTNYDFNLAIMPSETIMFKLTHNGNVYSKEQMIRICNHFKMVASQIMENPEINTSSINIIDNEEKQQLLVEFNNTKAEYQRDKTIQQLFEEQAAKTPENMAVVYNNESLNYRELNEKSNQLARMLREKGVKPDTIVGIMVDRSLEMIVGIMGILKAGAAYLPIDSAYPEDRIRYILSDSGTNILLQKGKDNNYDIEAVALDGDFSSYSTEAIEAISNYNNLAYIIYTSGSTGKPKGTMIKQRGLVNYITWADKVYVKNESLDFPLYSSFSFDLTVTSIFTPLISGNKIVVYKDQEDEPIIRQVFKENKVGIVKLTPAHLSMIKDIDNSNSSIKRLILGGEDLKAELAREVYESFNKNVEIYNEYGPTETVVGCMLYKYDYDKDKSISVSIGKPADNVQIYILDKEKQLLPTGIAGEIYVGGDGVSKGYINREELTAEKFIANPFIPGEQMYRTGDLARWMPDGNIEFLGRIDNQVKIRGFRIELGEIEARLLSYEGIEEVIVIAREDKDSSYLCAYVSGTREFTISELRAYLNEELPEYMIPSYFIQLEKLPITANGKVDRKSLPEPDGSIVTGAEYVAPTSETEEKLAVIWQEVLVLEKVGINDNFFELGGHSLKAINISAKINMELNVSVPLREIFKTPTIKGLADYVKGTKQSIYSRIEPAEENEYYPLSSAQKRMYALQQFEENSTSYNIPMVMTIVGVFDKSKLEKAFDKLIQRHEALRTSFEIINGEPVQVVHKEVSFKIEYAEADKEKAEEIATAFVKAFDLRKAPLLRVTLTKINDTEHILMIDKHHIISDGVSMGILTNEFIELYDGKELPKLRIQYKDFAVWQNEMFKSGEIKKQEEYWLNVFNDEAPVLSIPTDYQRPNIQSFEGDSIGFELNEELTDKLKQIAKETGSTMYMVLLSACNILLSRYSGQEDIIIGSPIAGRPHADLQNIMGMFVNTLAMRNYPESDKTIKEFLIEVKTTSLQAFENQDYQFEELIDKLNIKRDLSRNPLFDVMFSMQNIDTGELQIEGLRFKPYEIDNKIAKLDMTITAIEANKTIVIDLNYCTKLFNKQTIENMSKHLISILNSIAKNTSIRLSELEMLSEEEIHKVLVAFNNTKAEYPKDKTLYQLFEEQAAKTPDNIAALFEEESITYKELDEKSNQLARLLIENGVAADSIVAISLYRSLEMTIGIMAIQKAGGAYLPIDPKYPEDRIRYILEDSNANVLLTQSHLQGNYKFEDITVIAIDNKELYRGDSSSLQPISGPNNLAYVIYTSGSTGKPKGVMIEHHSVINRTKWMQKRYPIGENDVILQKTPYTFDVSVGELFWWSMTGAKVCFLKPEGDKDPEEIAKAIEKYKVTTMNFVPSMLNIFLEHIENRVDFNKLSSLKQVFSIGEALTVAQVEKFNRILNSRIGTKLINIYGPTETTVEVSYFDCSTGEHFDVIPIGKPIDNISLLVVDKHNNLLPIGVPGELCISGVGVGRGYLNKPELTAEMFLQNPHIPGERMYRSGDLARWLPDGNIEYLGRMDNQVKIRGNRIELGEIETRILSYEGIEEAVVIAKEDNSGNKYLCAYIAVEREQTLAELREHLSKELPEYMIPTYFIQLEKLPLTANGKIDRKALPEPDGNIATGIEYVAPTNEIEETLAAIWSEVLGIEKVGINDNFFELGGHSLKAINISAKINKELNVSVPLREMFETPTIKGLAEYVKDTKLIKGERSLYWGIEPTEVRPYYPASLNQASTYAMQQFDKQNMTYNMPCLVHIEGSLDIQKIENAFNKLVQRHEALRTSFSVIEGEIVQKIHKDVTFKINRISLCEENCPTAEALVQDYIRPFDLSTVPLLRVNLIELTDEQGHGINKYILIYDMHHIISDAASAMLMLKELTTLYEGKHLPELRLQYKDCTMWQKHIREGGTPEAERMKKQESYWINRFEGKLPRLTLHTDFPRPSIQSFEGEHIEFKLDEVLTNKLREIGSHTRTTFYMIFLAAFNILLSKYSGQEDIVVGSPVSGRSHEDLQNVMGMFINTLAIRNYPQKSKTFRIFLEELKKNTLGDFENQDYELGELIEKLGIQRETNRNPLFDAMFNMLNVTDIKRPMEDKQTELLTFTPWHFETKASKFDITLIANEDEDGLIMNLEYCTKLFRKETMEKMKQHYIQILETVVENIDIKLEDIVIQYSLIMAETSDDEEDIDFTF